MIVALLSLSACGDDETTGPQPTGSVEVTTSTTGSSLDPDGYTVIVAGGTGQPIGVEETVTVNEVATDARSVELTDAADNCTVDGDNPRDVTVAADATVSTTFDVNCLDFVPNRIAITTDRTGNFEIYLPSATCFPLGAKRISCYSVFIRYPFIPL